MWRTMTVLDKTENYACDVLPLDFVVGVDSGALMGSCTPIGDGTPMDLMANVEDVIGVPADDVNPDDEALPDDCVT